MTMEDVVMYAKVIPIYDTEGEEKKEPTKQSMSFGAFVANLKQRKSDGK